jgi:Xaa-Pro aminopeptidase
MFLFSILILFMTAKILYSSTENADMRYIVRASIPDAFLSLELNSREYIVLDKREYDAYLDSSTRNIAIEVLALEDFVPTSTLDLFVKVFEKFSITEIQVSDQFPLKLFLNLQEKGIIITVVDVFLPERWIKSEEEIGYIEASIWATEEALDFVKTVLKESRIVGETLEYKGEVLTSESLKKKVELISARLIISSS